jgi:glycosyltransferase involved in cell wall biosynthesis
LKIHLYCNTLNTSYYLCKYLRAKGHEAIMFLDNISPLEQDYPWWEDQSLSPTNLPSWIKYYEVVPKFAFPQPLTKKMIEDFKDCDVALVWGMGPILAMKAGVPFFFCSLGTDLNNIKMTEKIPLVIERFLKKERLIGVGHTKTFKHDGEKHTIKDKIIHYYLQRKALYEADYLGVAMGYQISPYVKGLGVYHKMKHIRIPWDINLYAPQPDEKINQKYANYDVVYFAPARHSWSSVWEDLKGNNKYIIAFARFVKAYKPNVKLISVEKGIDLERSKEIIRSEGIEDFVEWLPELNKSGIKIYNSIPNCVFVDQFFHDEWYKRYPKDKKQVRSGFGFAAIEAIAAKRPLITTFTDEEFYEGNHPPILSAFTIDEIYQRFVQSWKMSQADRDELGEKAQAFAYKYHHWENTIDLYVDILEEIVEKHKKKK